MMPVESSGPTLGAGVDDARRKIWLRREAVERTVKLLRADRRERRPDLLLVELEEGGSNAVGSATDGGGAGGGSIGAVSRRV
jgi:hypothetical protein